MTSSNGNIFHVTGEFPSQRPVTRSFGVFFDLRLNKLSSEQSRRRWFETRSRQWWRHWNAMQYTADPYMLPHWGQEKWPPFCRRNFQMHFLEWKYIISIKISLKFVPKGSINNTQTITAAMHWISLFSPVCGDFHYNQNMVIPSYVFNVLTLVFLFCTCQMSVISTKTFQGCDGE